MKKNALRMAGTYALGALLTMATQQDAIGQTNDKRTDKDVWKEYFAIDTSEQGGLFIRCQQKANGTAVVEDIIYTSPKAEIFFVSGKKADYMEKIVINAAWDDVYMHVYWNGETQFKQVQIKQDNIQEKVAVIMQDAQHMCVDAAQRRMLKGEGTYGVKIDFDAINGVMVKGGQRAFSNLALAISPPQPR